MFPQSMLKPELRPDDSLSDPIDILEQHLRAGFPPDLALDLVLNEVVVRAAEATGASAAALALTRGDEMVCRAATGPLAPDLGVPLNTRDGLSGACLQTRQPQLSVDTEFDPRIDPGVSRQLGIRSILIVPVFDANDRSQFEGILEVFSSSAAAFSHKDQKVLERFAEECARIRQAAIELGQRKPQAVIPAESVLSGSAAPDLIASDSAMVEDLVGRARLERTSRYEVWTLVLGSLAIVATIAVSFLIGSRIGWLSPPGNAGKPVSELRPDSSVSGKSVKSAASKTVGTKSTPASTVAPADELVIYEKGKVVFRVKPTPNRLDSKQRGTSREGTIPGNDAVVEASSTTKISPTKIDATKTASAKVGVAKSGSVSPIVWLSPEQAEARLLSRSEPRYPPEALTAHRGGEVVLEVQVAEDGSVSGTRLLSGDPILAAAAAEAVRNWRYEPIRRQDRLSPFQTDVTLSFTLPN